MLKTVHLMLDTPYHSEKEQAKTEETGLPFPNRRQSELCVGIKTMSP